MPSTANPTINSLSVVLTSIHGVQLLLPSAAVAEIIEYQATQSSEDDQPTWYLGQLAWRGLQIPLVSLEGMNHDAFFTQSRGLKIVVVHSLLSNSKLPHWAFVVMETPRMMRIERERLHSSEESTDDNRIAAMWAQLDETQVLLPDLQVIEEQLLSVVV